MERSPSGVRCLAVWCALSAVAGIAGSFAVDSLPAWSPGAAGPRLGLTFEELIIGLAAVAALVSLAWLWLTSSAVLLGAAAGKAWSVPGCPAPLRHALFVACGVALASGLAPAHATPGQDDPGRADQAAHQPELSGLLSDLPLPDRAESVPDGAVPDRAVADGATTVESPHGGPERPRTARRDATDRPATPPATRPSARPEWREAGSPAVTVRAGDTLWAIAARHLPGDAPHARIATEVGLWHRHNQAVIGSDPDLILPGQQLTPPSA